MVHRASHNPHQPWGRYKKDNVGPGFVLRSVHLHTLKASLQHSTAHAPTQLYRD